MELTGVLPTSSRHGTPRNRQPSTLIQPPPDGHIRTSGSTQVSVVADPSCANLTSRKGIRGSGRRTVRSATDLPSAPQLRGASRIRAIVERAVFLEYAAGTLMNPGLWPDRAHGHECATERVSSAMCFAQTHPNTYSWCTMPIRTGPLDAACRRRKCRRHRGCVVAVPGHPSTC